MLRENSSDVGINNQLTTLSSAAQSRHSKAGPCAFPWHWWFLYGDPSLLWRSIGAASALPLQWLTPQLPKCWNHQPEQQRNVHVKGPHRHLLFSSLSEGELRNVIWWEGDKDLLCTNLPALVLSLVASPSPLLQQEGRKPIYKYFSPNQSKNRHPEPGDKRKLARNPVGWVCKAQQLMAIRYPPPPYP